MTLPTHLPQLSAIQPYKAMADSAARHNLSANEACLGASPLAIAAARVAMADPSRYPDGSAAQLRVAIGERHGLNPELIICSAGSEELISLTVQAYAAPGDEVLLSQYGFIKYELAARAYGCVPVHVLAKNFTADVDALLEAVSPRTRVLFLANPNNPTGTYLPASEVARLRKALREDVLLVVDAAYAEFVEEQDYSDGLDLASSTGNTLTLRTFSKIHGLAGLRCGWGYGDARLIEALNKVRGAFNVSTLAQAAANAAIQDRQHEQLARTHNTQARAKLVQQLQQAGLTVLPSVCNFIVVLFKDAKTCAVAQTTLKQGSVVAMPLTGYGLPQAMRISIGTDEANHAVSAVLMGFAE